MCAVGNIARPSACACFIVSDPWEHCQEVVITLTVPGLQPGGMSYTTEDPLWDTNSYDFVAINLDHTTTFSIHIVKSACQYDHVKSPGIAQ